MCNRKGLHGRPAYNNARAVAHTIVYWSISTPACPKICRMFLVRYPNDAFDGKRDIQPKILIFAPAFECDRSKEFTGLGYSRTFGTGLCRKVMICPEMIIQFAFVTWCSWTTLLRHDNVCMAVEGMQRSSMSRNRGLRSICHMCGLSLQRAGHELSHRPDCVSLKHVRRQD